MSLRAGEMEEPWGRDGGDKRVCIVIPRGEKIWEVGDRHGLEKRPLYIECNSVHCGAKRAAVVFRHRENRSVELVAARGTLPGKLLTGVLCKILGHGAKVFLRVPPRKELWVCILEQSWRTVLEKVRRDGMWFS